MTVRAVVSAGSNEGNREGTLSRGLQLLAVHPQVAVRAISPVYETDPVGGPEQDDYLNLVALLDTELDAAALLGLLHVVEAACSRRRLVRWGPRTLDLDLIVHGDTVVDSDDLTLPHPRAHERAFVLVPWADLDADAQIPGRGAVADLLAALDRSGVRARPDLEVTA